MQNLLSMLNGEIDSNESVFHPQSDREGYKIPNGQFSIEYLIMLENASGEFQREVEGEVFGKTTSSLRYEFNGIIHFRLKDEFRESEDRRFGSFHNPALDDKIQVEIYRGELYGTKIRDKGEPVAKVTLSDELVNFCGEYFLHMGMFGKINLTSLESFPPNLSKAEIVKMLTDQLLKNRDFQRYSKFHKNSVLKLYA